MSGTPARIHGQGPATRLDIEDEVKHLPAGPPTRHCHSLIFRSFIGRLQGHCELRPHAAADPGVSALRVEYER